MRFFPLLTTNFFLMLTFSREEPAQPTVALFGAPPKLWSINLFSAGKQACQEMHWVCRVVCWRLQAAWEKFGEKDLACPKSICLILPGARNSNWTPRTAWCVAIFLTVSTELPISNSVEFPPSLLYHPDDAANHSDAALTSLVICTRVMQKAEGLPGKFNWGLAEKTQRP